MQPRTSRSGACDHTFWPQFIFVTDYATRFALLFKLLEMHYLATYLSALEACMYSAFFASTFRSATLTIVSGSCYGPNIDCSLVICSDDITIRTTWFPCYYRVVFTFILRYITEICVWNIDLLMYAFFNYIIHLSVYLSLSVIG